MKVRFFLATLLFALSAQASASEQAQPQVVEQLIQKAKSNTNWKVAFVTGKYEQIVFMNISPLTNPKNEIGAERHSFDQVILIVEGRGKAVLGGKTSFVEEGDMIFIPEGTVHNVINIRSDHPLKLISFYSDTDIPKGSIYRTKADEQH